jgi:hypothetical protein
VRGVGIAEPGGNCDLAQEAIAAERSTQVRSEDLQSDPAVELEILGQVDRSHPAPTELALDRISLCQSSCQQVWAVEPHEGFSGILSLARALRASSTNGRSAGTGMSYRWRNCS